MQIFINIECELKIVIIATLTHEDYNLGIILYNEYISECMIHKYEIKNYKLKDELKSWPRKRETKFEYKWEFSI